MIWWFNSWYAQRGWKVLSRTHICPMQTNLAKNKLSMKQSSLSKSLWHAKYKQDKSEGFDTCDRPSNLKLDSNHRFFSPCDLEIWWMTLKNNRVLLLYYVKLCASFQIHQWIRAGVTVRKCSIQVKIDILSPVTLKFDGWPWKKNRAPLLYYIELCASFQIHRWSQTWITVRKRSIQVKIGNFLSRVTLNLDEWPWKTIGHLFYAASNFVHHFIAIGKFKLELQSGSVQFGSKSTILLAVWPWNLMDGLEKQ